jgi:hypothetical protein
VSEPLGCGTRDGAVMSGLEASRNAPEGALCCGQCRGQRLQAFALAGLTGPRLAATLERDAS